MRLSFVGLLLFASTALGQSVTFSAPATILQNNKIVVSRENCREDRTVSWTRAGALCETLYLWLSSDGTCNRAPAAADLSLQQIAGGDTTTTSGTLTLRASDALARGGDTCESQNATTSFRLCASTNRVVGDIIGTTCQDSISSVGTPTIDFVYDPEPPPAPAAPTVTGLDSALSAHVTVSGDAALMRVEVRQLTEGEDGGVGVGELVTSKEQIASNTVFRLDGLENGVEYAVRAIAVDAAGNTSEPSPIATGTPVASNGFYGGYIGAGGAETGGCTAAGGGITGCAVLASLGIWLSRRKRS